MQHTVQTIGLTEKDATQTGFFKWDSMMKINWSWTILVTMYLYLSVRKLGVTLLYPDPTGSGIVTLPTLLGKVLEKFKFNEYFIEFKIFEIF